MPRTPAHHGYSGRYAWQPDAAEFYGRVAGIRDVVTFRGRTAEDAEREFRASVDAYLAFCRERGKAPDTTETEAWPR
jgi:predicted HicB family RNase H-like nuclease